MNNNGNYPSNQNNFINIDNCFTNTIQNLIDNQVNNGLNNRLNNRLNNGLNSIFNSSPFQFNNQRQNQIISLNNLESIFNNNNSNTNGLSLQQNQQIINSNYNSNYNYNSNSNLNNFNYETNLINEQDQYYMNQNVNENVNENTQTEEVEEIVSNQNKQKKLFINHLFDEKEIKDYYPNYMSFQNFTDCLDQNFNKAFMLSRIPLTNLSKESMSKLDELYKSYINRYKSLSYLNEKEINIPLFEFKTKKGRNSNNTELNCTTNSKELLKGYLNGIDNNCIFIVNYGIGIDDNFTYPHYIDEIYNNNDLKVSITGRAFQSVFNKLINLSSLKINKIQTIDFNKINDNQVKSLMKNIFVPWYIYLYAYVYNSTITSNEIIKSKDNLIFKLYYTTIKNSSCMNVNFNIETNINTISGFANYFNKSESNNFINIMFLTQPRVLLTSKTKGQRGSKNILLNNCMISYINPKSKIEYRYTPQSIYRRHGKAKYRNQVILGPSKRTNNINFLPSKEKNKEKILGNTNFEYKYINSIEFEDDKNKIEILVIPYIVNQKREDCYKYDIFISFYTKEDQLISRLYGEDFFIYEECVNDYIECLHSNDFSGYIQNNIPAAIESTSTIIPPVLNIDNIILEKGKEINLID